MKIELTEAERALIVVALHNYDCNLPGEEATMARVFKKLRRSKTPDPDSHDQHEGDQRTDGQA